MSDKELQIVVDEKVEELSDVVNASVEKLDEVVKQMKEQRDYDLYKKAAVIVGGATLVAGYLPLRKHHRKLATVSLLVGVGVLAAQAIATVLEDDE